jgi:hypothetical protein
MEQPTGCRTFLLSAGLDLPSLEQALTAIE